MGTFCPRNKEGDDHAQYGGGCHDIPVLDEADMNLVTVLLVGVLAGVFGEVLLVFILMAVRVGMCGDGDAHDAFAEEGDDRIAQRRHADGADIADNQHEQEVLTLCMKAKERGGYHRTQQDVARVKDAEHHGGCGFGDILEKQHKTQTKQRPNRGERSVPFQFGADMFDLLNYRHLIIPKKISQGHACVVSLRPTGNSNAPLRAATRGRPYGALGPGAHADTRAVVRPRSVIRVRASLATQLQLYYIKRNSVARTEFYYRPRSWLPVAKNSLFSRRGGGRGCWDCRLYIVDCIL